MPGKKKYRFSQTSKNTELMRLQKEIEDNYRQYQEEIDILPDHSTAKRGYFLKTDGKKAYWDTHEGITAPGVPSIPGSVASLHASTHENGGADEIDLNNEIIAMSVALGMP